MRILAVGNVYPPHALGGYEIVWSGVTQRLRAAGHATRVLTTGYRSAAVGADAVDDPDVYRDLRWYWHDHAWPRLGPRTVLSLERHNAAVLARHLDEFAPDVIAWWPMGGMSLALIERVRRRGLPAVLFVHDYWPNYGPQVDRWARFVMRRPRLAALAGRLTGLPGRIDLARAGRWLFNSEAVWRDTVAAGLRPGDAGVLAPGISRSLLEQPREPQPPPWRWRLLVIGRVVEQKGVDVAISALAQLPDEATLRIVGDGDSDLVQRLRALAVSCGVAERVLFEPACTHDAVPGIYRAADVVVFPICWDEPWGLVPLEAMALGRPVVATARGGSAEFLRDGDNALLFESRDSRGLAAAVRRLAAESDLRARLREGGYSTASRHSEDAFNAAAVAELELAAGDPQLGDATASLPGAATRPRAERVR